MSIVERVAAFVETRWHISMQMLRYLISGGTVVLTELAALYVFTDLFRLWYEFSLVIAFVIALCVSFTLQKFWTFGDRETSDVHKQASSYVVVQLLNLAVNAAALYVLVQYFGMWYLLAQLLVSALIALWNFLIYKFIIFKRAL